MCVYVRALRDFAFGGISFIYIFAFSLLGAPEYTHTRTYAHTHTNKRDLLRVRLFWNAARSVKEKTQHNNLKTKLPKAFGEKADLHHFSVARR